jgi:hypothetical protein
MEPAINPSSLFADAPTVQLTTPPADWQLLGNTSLVFAQILAWTNGQPDLTESLSQMATAQQHLLKPGREIAFVNQLVQTYFVPDLIDSPEPKDQKVAGHLNQVQTLLLSDKTRDQALLHYYRKCVASPTGRRMDNSFTKNCLVLSGLISICRVLNLTAITCF